MDGHAQKQAAGRAAPKTIVDERTRLVLHRFDHQVLATPDAAAVVDGSRTLSFQELNARADQFARRLRSQGVGRHALAAIAVDRSLEMLVCVLGVLKSGAGYVPLDPSYPQARLRVMLSDSRAALLISQQSFAQALALPEIPVLSIGMDWSLIAADAPSGLPPENEADDLCYVIYTSGSTGMPKGVAMSHGALANLIAWQLGRSVNPARTAQFAPLSFDVSFQEIFATWCGGGALVVVPEAVRRNPGELLALLQDQSVERLFLPYVALQQLAEEAVRRHVYPASLREVVTAGEQLKITPAIGAFFAALSPCTLENQYGPSETHVVTSHTLSGPPQAWPRLPPIGKPIANTKALVLDSEMRPVAPGVEGELFIAGAALANGYLYRPDLTEERFVSSPFSEYARLYRTGDLVACLPSGDLQFLGRSDEQVKVRGFRVELGEIEQALLSHPDIRQAAVAVRIDGSGENGLAAYLVADPNAALGTHDIRTFLAQRLPDYLIPSAVLFLDTLPLTPSGKVDRRALPLLTELRRDLATSYLSPQSGLEAEIAAIWRSVLQIDRVGADDNFFELGGTSLQMIEAQRRLASVIQPEPDITALFQYPTVASLAKTIVPKARKADGPLTASERAQRQRTALAQHRRRQTA